MSWMWWLGVIFMFVALLIASGSRVVVDGRSYPPVGFANDRAANAILVLILLIAMCA